MRDLIQGSVICTQNTMAEAIALPVYLREANLQTIQAWRASRSSLRKAFECEGVVVAEEHLRVAKTQQLLAYPEWRFSLSHNEEYSAAWLTPETENGIGIDIENASRVINWQLLERTGNKFDTIEAGIKSWTIKEAVYKCFCDDPLQKYLLFSRIQLLDGNFRIENSNAAGTYFQETAADNLLISYARSISRNL